MNKIIRGCVWAGLMLSAGAQAAVCTSLSAGDWNVVARWNCGHIPVSTDTVIIAHNAIRMRGNYTVAGLTVNAGAVLNDDGNNLTVNGNVVNNGTFGMTGGGGDLVMQTAGTTISGTGIFADARLLVDAKNISLPVGSVMNFTSGGNVRVGSNVSSSFFIAGTITDTGISAGNRILRADKSSTVTITGTLNAPNSYVEMKNTADTINNNGSVTLQYLKGKGVWTQAGSSSLTVSRQFTSWTGVLNASATGNTVTYTSPATPVTPSSNTYYNLSGSGVTCPHNFTVLGTNPCTVTPGTVTVTMNPGSCVSATGMGTVAWASASKAYLSDNLYATATVNGTTNYLKCTGYNFAIPATANILGITVNLERNSSSSSRTTDGAMRLVKAGVTGTVDRATASVYTTSDVVQGHGTSADLWGVAWTPADINLATFGAAFAAKTTKSRTVSVDYMPITVAYSMPAAAPHHIQIEHSGEGKTCAPELLTVKACADAACTANFTTGNVTGNVTWAGSPGGTLPFTIVSGGTGQATVSLAVTSAQTVTLSASSVSPAPTAGSSCTNLAGGAACSIPFAVSSVCLDAVEVGAAAATPIYLKLSGTPFSLDVKTPSGSKYTGTVQVELVDASAGSCSTYTQLNTQNVSFSNVNKKTVSFTYANASGNTRVRMTQGVSASCSSDGFVIRPGSLTVTSPANADSAGASKTATPVVKAGANFTLTATGIKGYDGTPVIDNALATAHPGAIADGLLAGVFSQAVVANGAATGSAFTYSEVGYFKFNANGVSDKSFANLDILDGDCTADFSNILVGGKYGCYLGNSLPTDYFGRFIPDHFETMATDECNGFTYSGQPFALEVSARGASGAVTQNYGGAFSKAVILSDALNAATLGAFTPGTIAAGSFASGLTTIRPGYAFTAVKTAPTIIGVRAAEAVGGDSVSSATPATPVEGTTEIRSGRVWVGNAYGSELLNLSVPVFAQYWNGSAFATNIDDDVASCTSFPAPGVILQPGGSAVTATMNPDPVVSGNVGFVGGGGGLMLTGPGVAGYADVTLAVPTWLQYAWSGAGLTSSTGRATFGVYGGNKVFIYRGRRGR